MVNNLLLKIYYAGFEDELSGKINMLLEGSRAYELGRTDALIGDDLTSVDNQTEREILKRIKDGNKRMWRTL